MKTIHERPWLSDKHARDWPIPAEPAAEGFSSEQQFGGGAGKGEAKASNLA